MGRRGRVVGGVVVLLTVLVPVSADAGRAGEAPPHGEGGECGAGYRSPPFDWGGFGPQPVGSTDAPALFRLDAPVNWSNTYTDDPELNEQQNFFGPVEVVIDWGDGSSTPVPSTECVDRVDPDWTWFIQDLPAGTFDHTYAVPGTYAPRVVITHTFGSGQRTFPTVTVTDGSTTTVPTTVPTTTTVPGGDGDPPPACPAEVAGPANPMTIGGAKWQATFAANDDDGLVVRDARLDGRLMAPSMSLPYVVVRTNRARRVIELQPDGLSGSARVRMSSFRAASVPGDIDDPPMLAASASWTVWWPDDGDSCLEVEQSYRFERPRPRSALPPTQRGWCNPSQSIGGLFASRRFSCARFYPEVSYRFHGEGGEELVSFQSPQRLHLRPGTGGTPEGGRTTSGLFRDCDTSQRAATAAAQFLSLVECLRGPNHHPVIADSSNPVEREFQVRVVRVDRRPGAYDNYHCVLGDKVPAPGIDAALPGSWGCPTCVHIHWRWGTGANYAPDRPLRPRYTNGVPLVASSAQTVVVAGTRAGPASLDPVTSGWQSLVNDQWMRQRDQVMWYVATSTAANDSFFGHGGFFADL